MDSFSSISIFHEHDLVALQADDGQYIGVSRDAAALAKYPAPTQAGGWVVELAPGGKTFALRHGTASVQLLPLNNAPFLPKGPFSASDEPSVDGTARTMLIDTVEKKVAVVRLVDHAKEAASSTVVIHPMDVDGSIRTATLPTSTCATAAPAAPAAVTVVTSQGRSSLSAARNPAPDTNNASDSDSESESEVEVSSGDDMCGIAAKYNARDTKLAVKNRAMKEKEMFAAAVAASKADAAATAAAADAATAATDDVTVTADAAAAAATAAVAAVPTAAAAAAPTAVSPITNSESMLALVARARHAAVVERAARVADARQMRAAKIADAVNADGKDAAAAGSAQADDVKVEDEKRGSVMLEEKLQEKKVADSLPGGAADTATAGFLRSVPFGVNLEEQRVLAAIAADVKKARTARVRVVNEEAVAALGKEEERKREEVGAAKQQQEEREVKTETAKGKASEAEAASKLQSDAKPHAKAKAQVKPVGKHAAACGKAKFSATVDDHTVNVNVTLPPELATLISTFVTALKASHCVKTTGGQA